MSLKKKIADGLLEELNITRDMINKVVSVIDKVDIIETEDEFIVEVGLKKITITIKK